MFGWFSDARTFASRLKRARRSLSRERSQQKANSPHGATLAEGLPPFRKKHLRQPRPLPRLAPRTHLDADSTPKRLHKIRYALVEVDVPTLDAPDPLLVVVDGVGRTVDDTTTAREAQIVHRDIDGLVIGER